MSSNIINDPGRYPVSYRFTALILLVIILTGCGATKPFTGKYVYQVSTIDSLSKGRFEGHTEILDIQKHGNHGLGTFNNINGEMIIYDGVVYRASLDGSLSKAEGSEKTPFAVITEFVPDSKMEMVSVSCDELKSEILNSFKNRKTIRAIQLKGYFDYIKYRSVKKQTKPYPPLSRVIKEQNVLHAYNTEGIYVGFWFPDDFRGVNATGFHLHFLNKQKTLGGHVLDCKLLRGIVYTENKKDIIISIN